MSGNEQAAKALIAVVMAVCGLLALLPDIRDTLFPPEPWTLERQAEFERRMDVLEQAIELKKQDLGY